MKFKIYAGAIAAILALLTGIYLWWDDEIKTGSLLVGSGFFSGLRALIWYNIQHK